MLYGSEAWCLKESEMGILWRTDRSMVRALCGVQFKDRKISTDLMLDLAMANCLLVWSCAEDRGWSCFEKGILF